MRQRIGEFRGNIRRQRWSSFIDFPNRFQDLVSFRSLEHISLGSCTQGATDVLFALVGSHDNDARFRCPRHQFSHDLQSVFFRHSKVEDENIRGELIVKPACFLSVACFTDHLDILGLQYAHQPFPDYRVIVGDENPDNFSSRFRGCLHLKKRLGRDLQADNDARSTPCAGFDLQISSKLLDPSAHISHAKAGGLFETTPAHPGSIVSDLQDQVRCVPTEGGGNDSWPSMASSIAYRFLTNPKKLMLNLRRYPLVRDIFCLQLATQNAGHVRTLDELLNGFDQSFRLNPCSQAQNRAARLSETKLGKLVCPLEMAETLCLRTGGLGSVQLH